MPAQTPHVTHALNGRQVLPAAANAAIAACARELKPELRCKRGKQNRRERGRALP